MTENTGYLGNAHLKKTGTPIEWTPELIQEYAKCAEDPIYFAKNYIKIVSIDDGLIPLKMYPYQEDIVKSFQNNRRSAVLTSRQAGKCVVGDTMVKLRNKKTGEIMTKPIKEFYESFT